MFIIHVRRSFRLLIACNWRPSQHHAAKHQLDRVSHLCRLHYSWHFIIIRIIFFLRQWDGLGSSQWDRITIGVTSLATYFFPLPLPLIVFPEWVSPSPDLWLQIILYLWRLIDLKIRTVLCFIRTFLRLSLAHNNEFFCLYFSKIMSCLFVLYWLSVF